MVILISWVNENRLLVNAYAKQRMPKRRSTWVTKWYIVRLIFHIRSKRILKIQKFINFYDLNEVFILIWSWSIPICQENMHTNAVNKLIQFHTHYIMSMLS